MGPGHQHGAAVSVAGAQRGRLLAVLAITAVTLVAEVAGGVITGRLALLADAGHMLTDVAGLALAVLAVTFAAKSPTAQRTYGCYRLEILAAVVNGMLLFAIAAWILVKAWQRFTARIRTADPNNLHPNRSGHLVQAQLAAGMLFCRARCRCRPGPAVTPPGSSTVTGRRPVAVAEAEPGQAGPCSCSRPRACLPGEARRVRVSERRCGPRRWLVRCRRPA
jgi:hypothetical protein